MLVLYLPVDWSNEINIAICSVRAVSLPAEIAGLHFERVWQETNRSLWFEEFSLGEELSIMWVYVKELIFIHSVGHITIQTLIYVIGLVIE